MVLKCCVPGCTSKGRFGFHKFPRDEGNCIKWQLKSRKRFLCTKYLPYSHYRICEKHFKANDYGIRLGRKRLNKVAVPSVAVPEDESVYEEHNYAYLQDQNGNLSDGVSVPICIYVSSNKCLRWKLVLFRIICHVCDVVGSCPSFSRRVPKFESDSRERTVIPIFVS